MRSTGSRLVLLALAAILIAGWCMRITDLDADPPETLSWSQGPYTDGALVVHNARNHVLFGSWIVDQARDIYFYPISNFATWLVFRISGVGRGQAALANTIFGIVSILMVSVGILRTFGPRPAWLMALLASFNYFFLMYDRLAIAEPAMIFLMSLSFLCFSFADRGKAGQFLAGFFALLAVLIGKAHAFYFPPAMLLAFLVAGPGPKEQTRKRLIVAIAGMAFALLAWGLIVGIPHGDYLFSQASQASYEKHGGDPGGVAKRIWRNLFDMGVQTRSVPRMPVVISLALVGLLGLLGKGRAGLRKENPITILFLFWLILGWISISTQSTPSPRYLLALLFPLLFFASRPLESLFHEQKVRWPLPREPLAMGASLLVIFFAIYQPLSMAGKPILAALRDSESGYPIFMLFVRNDDYFGKVVFAQVFSCIVTAILALFAWQYSKRKRSIVLPWKPRQMRALAAALLGSILLIQFGQWGAWKTGQTHYLRDASRDIEESLGPGAKLIGPYAPALGLDNRLPAYPFLGRYEYARAFEELEPTHMVIVMRLEQAAIEERYPDIVDDWSFVATYPIRMKYANKILIYRLPRKTTGVETGTYQPSSFEMAVEAMANGEWEGAHELLRQFLAEKPTSADGNYLFGVSLFKLGRLEEAIPPIQRALELRPGRPFYHFRLGEYFARSGRRELALAELRTAHELDPSDAVILETLNQMTREAP